MEDFWCLSLRMVRGVGSVIAKKLIDRFGSAENVFKESEDVISAYIGRELAGRIKSFSQWKEVENIISMAKKLKQNIIYYGCKDYPKFLSQIPDAPTVLFVMGNIDKDGIMFSIVGTRKPSSYGVDVARGFSSALSTFGITTVSGLALGIDTIVHRSTLDVGGKTIAVLGSSCENIYPYENTELAKRILEMGGAIVSEYPPGTPPSAENFPRRNRIIAGISRGTLVVEAPEKSGALITAYLALEYGREVFAIPGNITSSKSKGTNKLIKEGAHLVDSVDDILSQIVPSIKRQQDIPGFISPYLISPQPQDSLSQRILSILDEDNPIHIDDIIKRTSSEPSDVISTLTKLELEGLIVEEGMGFFRKVRKM